MSLLRRNALVLLMAALVALPAACAAVSGSGKVVTEERKAADFNRISFNGRGNLIITQTGEESLKIEAEDNIIKLISTEVKKQTLFIGHDKKRGIIRPTKEINIYVSVNDLRSVKLSGSGSIKSAGIKAKELTVTISGSGNADLKVNATQLSSIIAGHGEFKLSGEVEALNVSISGSGECDAMNLQCKTANIDISGSGKAEVHVTDKMNISIAGSGKVFYMGKPEIEQTISGSGSVKRIEE